MVSCELIIYQISNMKFKLKEKISISIILLCGLWYGATFLSIFRISNHRWLYHIGWVSCYLFSFTALILSVINLILNLKEFNINWKLNLLHITITIFPILFWLYVLGIL